MKKLFTLFVAMAMVTMSFAQLNESIVTNVQNNNMDRSDWFGFTSNSSSAFIFENAESEYLLRIPAGSIQAGLSITKVIFAHFTNENFSGYTGDPFGAEEYIIKFYTGTTFVPTSYIGSDEQVHTYDSLNPGTLAYSMVYAPTTTGIQEVTLTNAFTVPSGDFCVAIYSADRMAGGLCPTDDACATMSYAYMDDATGWWHYQFGNNGVYTHKPWFLAVYYDDGAGYQPKSDWYAEMYSPDDEATYPDETHWVMADAGTDSLYFYCGAFNMGVDSSYGFYTLDVYIDGDEPLYFVQDDTTDTEASWYGPNYGLRWGPITLCGREDLEEFGYNLGVTPLDLCFSISYHTDPAYNGIDPNLDNNTWCATYSETEPISIQENTTTLTVSPNPASTTITVENAAGSQIYVYNIAGQEVMSVESAEANETLNVSNLNAGLYIVRVVNGNEVSTAKVSIVR